MLLVRLALVLGVALASPHLVLWVLDDIGWADVGFHGSNFPTPNIDRLAKEGVILDRMYGMPQCSPSRSAAMTGHYAFHMGTSHFATILPGSRAGLPPSIPTLAEVLKEAGYATHMVGKWHLGYASQNQWPLQRGFQSFTGYLQGQTDYYNRTTPACPTTIKAPCLYPEDLRAHSKFGPNAAGYDFWSGNEVNTSGFGQYTIDSYLEAAQQVIAPYGSSSPPPSPLFLYFAEQLLHLPLQLPPEQKHLDACRGVTGGSASVNRTVMCAMASKLDDSMGALVQMLKDYGIWNNTLIWVYSDNGGMTYWSDDWPASASSNYPLRGGKTTLFEGGIRSVSFVSGGYLPVGGQVRSDLFHAVDILPTFAFLAGAAAPSTVDGLQAWDAIVGKAPLGRVELPVQVAVNPLNDFGNLPHPPHPSDGQVNYSTLIFWPYKILVGVTWPQTGGVGLDSRDGWWTVDNYTHIPAPPTQGTLLFNIEQDEGEHVDLSASEPALVANLTARLQQIWANPKTYVPDQINVPNTKGNPLNLGWIWAAFD